MRSRIPIPLIIAAVVIATGVIVFYIAIQPKFLWSSVENNTIVLVAQNSLYTFLVGGTSATITTNNTNAVIYYTTSPYYEFPIVYAVTPPTSDFTTSQGVFKVLTNASGVYLRYAPVPGVGYYYYLKQVAPNVWAPDFTGNYCAIDSSGCGGQIVNIVVKSVSNGIASVTYVMRNGFTDSGSSSVKTATGSATFTMTSEKVGDTINVFYGAIVSINVTAPLKVTVNP